MQSSTNKQALAPQVSSTSSTGKVRKNVSNIFEVKLVRSSTILEDSYNITEGLPSTSSKEDGTMVYWLVTVVHII